MVKMKITQYSVIFMIMFAIALYFAFDNYIGVIAGIVLGYSVGIAFEEDEKK